MAPYHCLIPSKVAGLIVGRSGSKIKQICEHTGAAVSVTTDVDTPAALSCDRVVTLRGSRQQKQGALAQIVSLLHQAQGVEGPGLFVLLLPADALDLLVGPDGATIRAIVDRTLAEVGFSGPLDAGNFGEVQLATIRGTARQTVDAVGGLDDVLARSGQHSRARSAPPARAASQAPSERSSSSSILPRGALAGEAALLRSLLARGAGHSEQAEIRLLLPSGFAQRLAVDAIARRSGSKLLVEGDYLAISGTALGNAMAALYVQELMT